MINVKKDVFLCRLKNVKVLDRYLSNISRCIDLRHHKLFGLKSHGSHILMEQLLPLALCNLLLKNVYEVLVELCSFFRNLCSKSLNPVELDKLQERIVLKLCHMKMLFPLPFFTVMVHLTVHLVQKAKCRGLMHYRWMYHIERYLGHLKSYVKDRAQRKGFIAEGYLAVECLTFYSRYLDGFERRFNKVG